MRAQVCGGPGTNCGRWVDVGGMVFTVTAEMLGCPVPRTQTCGESACSSCRIGVDVGGAPAEVNEETGAPALGPGAVLRYAGGGAGAPGLPGSPEWSLTLGRYWSHDQIGNRLTETRDGGTDTYSYQPNAAAGNTPLLQQITLPVAGTRDYLYGPAGHLTQVTAGANQILWTSDDEGRLSRLERPAASAAADFLYDGRSFLTRASDPATGAVTRPLYGSEGLLHGLRRQSSAMAPEEPTNFFYFAGRPVAQLHRSSGADTWTFLTTDHLGTPLVATDLAGTELWAGPFEPFGRDPQEGTPAGALEKGLFLRLPGQWDDGLWGDAALGAGVFYNVHRWYEPNTGRYTKTDPLGVLPSINLYLYAEGNSLHFMDPLGLRSILYDGCEVVFYDDNGSETMRCPATSGRPGTTVNHQTTPYTGPIPEGTYILNPRECSGGPIRSIPRRLFYGDWGTYRVPLHPAEETDTKGRDGFFMHGEKRPGSAGCVDIGGCDTFMCRWADRRPDDPITVRVKYGSKGVCN